jgi:HK97 family phage portal protein
MGILSWRWSKKSNEVDTVTPSRFYHEAPSHGANFEFNFDGLFGSLSPAALYESQPHLRTVVDFLGENIAQVGLQTFERDADGGRTRARDNVLARLIDHPNDDETIYEVIYAIVADLALYDIALLRVIPTVNLDYPFELRVIKASWIVGTKGGTIYGPEYYVVRAPNGQTYDFPAKDIIVFKGWSPDSYKSGSSKVNTLKGILSEQAASYKARENTWKRGGRVGGFLSRPSGAPGWSKEEERKFMRSWNRDMSIDGERSGQDILLQDGMTYEKTRYSAVDEGWIEGIKLSLATVAGVYHVNPAMIGNTEQLNYANVRELRKMLYGETLAPIFKAITQKLNSKLIRMLGLDPAKYYVEFNIREKLQGSFEEQAAVIQTLVGRPIMTANEARPLFNLTLLEDDEANQLATPLNMLLSGQTPAIGSTPAKALGAAEKKALTRVEVKARAASTYEEKVAQVLVAFFKRQQASVLSKLGSKAAEDWWDAERWNTELSKDLFKLALMVTEVVGRSTLEAAGYDGDEYNVDQTLAWLQVNSDARAEMINNVTKRQLDEVLEAEDVEDEEDAKKPVDVFEAARGNRAIVAASTLVTAYSAFGAVEAGQQVGKGEATKTWVTTGNNSRSAHKRMNNETVPVGEKFSNGGMWPGDAALDVDDLAGCKCDVVINFP